MAVRGRRESPWARLAGRDDIIVRVVDLSGVGVRAVCGRHGATWVVLLDSSLTRAERSSELAHELAHVDRGGGCGDQPMPATWQAVVDRDEAAADRAAADAMIPPDVLDAWLDRRGDDPTTVADVAAEWEAAPRLARIALAGASLRHHPSGLKDFP